MNLLPIDELNSLRTKLITILYLNGVPKKPSKEEEEDIIDEILDLLLLAYSFGCEDANEMLGTAIPPTYDEMHDSIYRKVAGKDFVQRVSEYLPECAVEDIMRVADTDMHRVYNEGASNTAVLGGATTKTYHTMLDDRVRDTHQYLEGTTIPINAEFYTYDGDHAFYPGGFELAENNVNCRCYLTYR